MPTHPSPHGERLVDEMAIALCDEPELNDDRACIATLQRAGFRGIEIIQCLDLARALARVVRTTEGDLWSTLRDDERDPDT